LRNLDGKTIIMQRKKSFRKKKCIKSKPKQDDGRIAAGNHLASIKNVMRERIKQEEHTEAVTSVIPKEVDKIVFDAGFFGVESTVKSFSVLSFL
jgi:disks large-associated protein 5